MIAEYRRRSTAKFAGFRLIARRENDFDLSFGLGMRSVAEKWLSLWRVARAA
jgi:hypothetical protein